VPATGRVQKSNPPGNPVLGWEKDFKMNSKGLVGAK
jgi:hypothetical protein